MDAPQCERKEGFRARFVQWCELWPRVCAFVTLVGKVVWRAILKYDTIDGEQRAASFAYYAFFALFPLILLFISIGSIFLDQAKAVEFILGYIKSYVPMPVESQEANIVVNTINGVMSSRKGAGIIAFLTLSWSSLRFFQALVYGVNRAWGTKEYSWWRLPIKNLAMVGILSSALLLGIIAPAITDAVERSWWRYSDPDVFDPNIVWRLFQWVRLLLPVLVLFYGFSMFYKFAPRRWTTFSQVWLSALLVTFALQALQNLFVWYATKFGNFNALYGAFGSVVALLMWIYLSGSIIILGGCLSAAQAEILRERDSPAPAPVD